MEIKLVGSLSKCGLETPHHPHYLDEGYDTVRYGWVKKFCVGIPAEDEDFIIEGLRGCACSLYRYRITIKKGTGKVIKNIKPTHDGRCA